MRKNIITLGLCLLAIISLPIGCSQIGRHYDYALDRENHSANCSSFFDNGRRYDFSTVIWAIGGDCKQPINGNWWPSYYIYTTHITTKADNVSKLEIYFENIGGEKGSKKVNVEIVKDSLAVSISTPQGKIISSNKSDLYKVGKNSWVFEQQYSQKLPVELIENISFDLLVNDKHIEVREKYPIKLQYHYNFWDQLMGI